MRTILLAVAALFVLTAAAAAQPYVPNPLNQENISLIEGITVVGIGDEKIGHVSAVLVDTKTKRVDRLVVSSGGVLGIGTRQVPFPLDQFSWNEKARVLKLLNTKQQLQSMPEYSPPQ